MNRCVALIGFGEAGATFAEAARWGQSARAFDVLPERTALMSEFGVTPSSTLAEALTDASTVISLVTADQALEVALRCAPLVSPGAFWCDMNSVAPGTKRSAALAVEEAGGRYVDVAIMAPVNPQRLAVPLCLSGPDAAGVQLELKVLGFTNTRVVGDQVGRASSIKMLRSVMYKGIEALTAECLLACERAGVTEEVLGSFGNDWASGADYRLDRMLVHGLRRAAELREVCKTLEDLGLPSRMSEGTAKWQQAFGELEMEDVPDGLQAKLDAIAGAAPIVRSQDA